MPLIDSFLFTSEITVLIVASRHWNTLKIVPFTFDLIADVRRIEAQINKPIQILKV